MNVKCRDGLLDLLLARTTPVHKPITRLILAGDAASDDEVTLADLPFDFDLYVAFVASVTDE